MPNELDLDTTETRADDDFGGLLLNEGLSSPVSDADVMKPTKLPPPLRKPEPSPSVPALPPQLGAPKPYDSSPEFDVSDFLPQAEKAPAPAEEVDLAALKLDSIIAEPDFESRNVSPLDSSEIPTVNLKVAPLSGGVKDCGVPDLSGLEGDNLQLDFAKNRVRDAQGGTTTQATVPRKEQAFVPGKFGVVDYLRQYAKTIVLLVIILAVGGYIGYNRYHHYKITQKHDLPMVEYNYDYTYIENFGTLPMQGNPDAVATLAIFCDFQCPYCPKTGDEVDEILAKYDGDVRAVWVNFPLPFHPGGYAGALMALMAYDQGKYWEMKDELFSHQDRLMDESYYKEAAKRVGVDLEDYDKNLKDLPAMKIFADDLVAGIEAGHSLGVGGTPAMAINRYVLPPSDKDVMYALIDFEVKRAKEVARETGLKGEALFRELLKTAPSKVDMGKYQAEFNWDKIK